jgi:predicted permease
MWLLRRLGRSARSGEIEGDLKEAYESWKLRGRGYARLRFWREVLMIPLWQVLRGWRERQDRKAGAHGHATAPNPGVGGRGRGLAVVLTVANDIRYGVRTMAHSPGFAVVAVLILALGIGANTTMFTLVNSLFVQAPPLISQPDRLVALTLTLPQRGGVVGTSFGYPEYEFYRDNNDVFSDIMAYDNNAGTVAVGLDDEIVQADAWTISYNFFDVLGVPLAAGRSFLREEDTVPGERPVVILSYGFWNRHFGADAGALGRSVVINGQPFRIVGVAPRRFRGPSAVSTPPDVFLPIMMVGTTNPGAVRLLQAVPGNIWISYRLVARLRDGVDLEGARAHMDVLQSRWERAFASWIESTFEGERPYRVGLVPRFHLTPRESEQLRQLLTPLFLAVAAVLLIACANIAILLLARASARGREMGIRAALGASRGRVVAQLLTESLLLAALGGVLGIAVANWGASLAAGLIPMSFVGDFKPDVTVIGFTLALSAGAAVLFGLVPAWQLSRVDISTFLHRQGHGKSRTLLRNALVVGQLTLSIVLVTGAGLFVRSLLNAQRVDLGFDRDRKLLMSVALANHGYSEESGREFIRTVLDRLEQLPGVSHATTTFRTPFRGMWTGGSNAPGTKYDEETFNSGFNRVGPGYFETMGIPIVAGRGFNESDDELAPKVVVVNQQVAEQVWPGENAVGKTIVRGQLEAAAHYENEWTVIGVAADAVYYEIGEDPWAQIYNAQLQDYGSRVTFVVATAGEPLAMVRQVEQVLRDYDPTLAIFDVTTLDDVVSQELGQFRIMAVLIVLFGLLALLLSAVGLYGVQAFLVARRTKEIGIRMALGALRRQVAGNVLGRGVMLAGIGVLLGLAAAYLSARLIQSLLFGVDARDPLTFVTVPVVLLLVAAAASLIPAVRASRVDPVEALREE